MKRIRKYFFPLLFLIALGAYALGGFVVAPWWFKGEFPQLVKTHLDATGSLGEVAINPFKLTVEVRDLAITEAGGSAPALAFDRLFVDFEAIGLFKRTWTLSEVTLERPRLNLEVDASDTLNLVKLNPRNATPGQRSSAELPRLLLGNLHLRQGQVVFTDNGLAPPAVAKIEPFEFELRDLSTLPNEQGEYTLSARLPAGGTLSWRGTVALAPVGSTGKIEVKDAKLATLWRFVQDRLQIEEPGGSAALTLDYEARYADNSMAATARNIALQVRDVKIREAGVSDAALTAGEVALTGGLADLAQRRVQFAELTLNGIDVRALIDTEGNANWAKIVAPAKPAVAPPAATGAKSPPAMPWQLGVDAINVRGMKLGVVDQVFVRPLAIDIARVAARARLKASLGAETNATVEGIGIEAEDIRVAEPGAKNALVSLPSASLADGSFDVARQKFSAAALKLGNPAAALTRDAKGTINLAAAFERRPLQRAEPSSFTAEIGAIELSGGNVAFQDHGIAPALVLDFQVIRVLAKNVTTGAKATIPFEVALQVKQGGAVRVHGTVTPDPQRASLKVEAKGIALAPFAPLLARHVTLRLASGSSAHAAGRLEWRAQSSGPSVRYTGNAGIDALRLDQETSGERVVGWKTMLAEGIDFDSVQRAVRIDDVRVTAPSGRIAIAKDRSTNLSDLVRKAPAGEPAASSVPVEPSQPFAFSIERIQMQDGDLDFSDQSLVLPFAALVGELRGSIAGLSSQPGTRASLKLEGRVDEYGQARAAGSLNPFEPKAFTDITVNFRNVAMSPLSPYSATFAGRRIASGTLSLDLHYKLNDGQLLGENRALMEKFTLGERVESPSAVSLPLDLAIALLTDADGKIDISVPVRGNVDQPEFSYGPLVWQAIRTVLTSIVTAPFRALASLFGGAAAEKVDAIAFEAGRMQLAPPEREKLTRVIAVLKQRPKLRLVVEGRYDSARDGAALRVSAARRALADRLGVQSSGGDDAPLVNFDNAKAQRAIEALLEERAGSEAVAKFQAGYEKSAGKPVSRVNPVLALVGRGSADRAFYEAMFEQAAALQPLEKDALSTLATQRASAIMEFLKAGAGLEDARLASKPAVEMKATNDAEITSALGLEGPT